MYAMKEAGEGDAAGAAVAKPAKKPKNPSGREG
jgi:hypothetical protein